MIAADLERETVNALGNDTAALEGWSHWFWRSPARFLCLVAALFSAVFHKIIFGGHTFFYRDFGVLAYPFIFYHRECFWRGELPLWNPLSNCGAPFLAQWGTMTLYPFSLIYLLLPLPFSLNLFCFAHLALGALGLYLLAFRWVKDRFASAVAGVVYGVNGITFSCLLWPNYTVALGWLPWVLLSAERGWLEGGRRLVLASLVSALQLLSGAPEIILFTWLGVGAFWLRDLFLGGPGRGRLVFRLFLVVLLASGLAAVQLLPFLDLLAHSQRNPDFASAKWAMPGWGWANLLVPMFHCFQTPQGTFFQFGQEFLSSYYLGGTTLLLALWAAWKVRRGTVWILTALLFFSLILALGDSGRVYTWLRQSIPLLGVGRYPVKFIILAAFTVPLLAAFALAGLDKHRAGAAAAWRSLLALAALLALAMAGILRVAKSHPFPYDQWDVTLANTVWRFVFLGVGVGFLLLLQGNLGHWMKLSCRTGLLAALALDMLFHYPNPNPTLPSAVMAPGLWQQHQTSPPPRIGQARVLITPQAEKHLLRSTVADHLNDLLGKRLALWSNLNLLDGIPKVNGSSTLQLREQKEVQDLLYEETNTVASGWIDFLAVSHRTAEGSAVEWTNRPTHLPWISGGQKPLYAGPEEILRLWAGAEFDPRAVVYLSPEARAETASIDSSLCRITPRTWAPHRISFTAEADRASIVVIAQSFYHPWEAWVDGEPANLWRANHAFQSLVVPAGIHEVQLRYRDRQFQAGLGISLVALLLCGLVLARPGGSRGRT